MSGNTIERFFPGKITKKQASDSGMALVLISLIVALYTNENLYVKIALAMLVINMVFPRFYHPFAIVWLGFSNLLGAFVPKIILTIIYIVLVIPVGLIRKLFAKDPLLLKQFKKSTESVMKTRNHLFSSKDIETPY